MPEPSVYCNCGAQWHRDYVRRAADIIRAHEQRHDGRCGLISHVDFVSKGFRCACTTCATNRGIQRRMRRKVAR